MWPSTLSTFTNPTPSDRLNSPSHSSIETAQNSAATRLETFIGVITGATASAVGTLLYDIRSPDSNGGGHIQTANKGGTGQTSYNKGDVLVASSSSILTKLAVGTDGQSLVADSTTTAGIKWGVPGATPTVRVYTSSVAQTWNKPSTLSYALIQVQAPGGSGATGTANGGGGAGAYVQKYIAASALPTAASVLVRGYNTGSILTYFGSVLQALGGTNATANLGGAAGSVVIAGDLNYNGQAGMTTTGANPGGGSGGNSYLGKGGSGGPMPLSATDSNTGQDGNYGGGGGGGTPASDGNPQGTGGNGGEGVIIITEY